MEFKGLRVALVHDWLTGYRGGERVLDAIAEIFPDAPIYTLVHVPGAVPKTIESHAIKTSFLQHLPMATTKYRHYLPLFPLAAETLIDKKYDLIVSTSHAVAKSVRTHGAKHWCYIHSPMRYVWDRFDDYFGADRVGWLASRLFFKPIAAMLRSYDRCTATRVSHYAANSHFVAQRVQSFYHRVAEVIHPPVAVEKFADVKRMPQDYYLFFSALVPYKRADLAIQACEKLGRKIKIVGGGPELSYLKSLAKTQLVSFHEKPSDDDVKQFYGEARALIFPAVEDFGIVPVEALAAGLPVIGLREGGLLDSQNDQTCEFFKHQTVEDLSGAILRFEKNESRFQPEILRQKAQAFSKERFLREVRTSISSIF